MNKVHRFNAKEMSTVNSNHNIEFFFSPKWVRVFFGGEFVADSKNVILVRQKRRSPVYYFPQKDVRLDFLEETGRIGKFPGLGNAALMNIQVRSRSAENAAWLIVEPEPPAVEIEGFVGFKWGKMDAWFEEDEAVFVHPRDPRVRIDVLHSSRDVRVELEGEIIAETDRPVMLFETGLPPRYYIPLTDVRLELLEASDTQTACPYKGVASYYSANVGGKITKDVAWYYPSPYTEVGKIQNMLAFYPEKVDAVYVDGIKQ
jgi:uncharacterized protein (DUF427 family)